MKIAVVGQPGAWSTERLAAAVRGRGADALVVDLTACSLRLPDPRLFHRGVPLEDLDGAIVKKIGDTVEGPIVRERINMLQHLAASGVPVWSEPDRLAVAVNRYRMTLELARAGLPIPETVITEDPAEAAAAVERFGTAVLKPLFTSKGRGMRRLERPEEIDELCAQRTAETRQTLYVQRFVKHPGRDLGVAVLEGRPLGAYWRVAAAESWMTTVLSGGRYEAADPPPAAVELALRAARRFGLIFTGVDLMETPDGGFTILEVSAFGGFRGLLSACGIDAAPLVAEAVLRRARGREDAR